MYNIKQRQQLLQLARDSIRNGLKLGRALPVRINEYETDLQKIRACFVTLLKDDQLRGCIGSLEAGRPLVEDVSENAYSAAFRDPRFNSLQPGEFDQISISLSILSPATDMMFNSEQDLIEQIQPNVDGLILQEGSRCGTFLPSVWKQLPDPKQFLQQLKRKAGFSTDYWSDSVRISRYQTESFDE